MEIKYLKHNEIDKQQWDKCIANAFNGIVYSFSWYLDIVSNQWEALVFDDYKAVMPLTCKKKYGLSYIFQPRYTQQLGVFSQGVLDQELVKAFIGAIPVKYKIVDINLNTYNKLDDAKLVSNQGVTYELDLIQKYKDLGKNFNSNTQRNIKKAINNKVQVSKHVNLKDLLILVKKTSKIPLTFDHLNILRRLIPLTISNNLGNTYGAYNDKNELVAAAFFIRSHNKTIYLISAATQEAKELSAMFLLVDQFIKDNAERDITLDFEGSVIENIARFYRGFGASPINYNKVSINRLPWFLKFIR